MQGPKSRPVESEKIKPLTFHVAESGLETRVHEVLSDEEFFSRDQDDFEPNMSWYSVKVANEEDKKIGLI